MVYLYDVVNKEQLDDALDSGMVTERFHPDLPLTILNYTPACQYSRAWNDTTRACRGLIYDNETMEVVARPFPKFFNWNEPGAPQAPKGRALRMPKADGSLGIIFNYNGNWLVATRGSFISEQAIWAQRWLDSKTDDPTWEILLDPSVTYLGEIIFPGNRIVLDYSGLETVMLLDAIDTETGKSSGLIVDAPFEHKADRRWVEFDPEDVKEIEDGEGEGFVYFWPHENIRLKVKSEWYVKTHRIVTNLTERSVWELMVEGKTLDEIKEPIPEEFYEFVESTHAEILAKQRAILEDASAEYSRIMSVVGFDSTRKEFAQEAVKSPLSKYLFLLHDRREIGTLSLQEVKPPATLAPIDTKE